MSKVPDLFKRPSTLASLRPAAIQQYAQQQQQQHASEQAEPQLLQRLHACLDEAAIQEAMGQQRQSTKRQKACRQLDAYHRVFELLLASLTTYRPLLLRIKSAYDEALKDAAAAACDNVYLQSKMAMVRHRHAEAVGAARQAAEEAAALMESELQHKLAQLQQETQQVETECLDVETQLQHMQKHMAQARRELDQLEAFSRRAHKELIENSSWHMLSSGENDEQQGQPRCQPEAGSS